MRFHSHDIQTFLRCEQKFDYNVVRNLEPIESSEAVRRGACIHNLLAHYHNNAIPIDSEMQYGDVMDDCNAVYDRWRREQAESDNVDTVLSVEWAREVAIRNRAFQEGEQFDLVVDIITYKPDLIFRDKLGELVVRDWKTVSSMPGDIGEARNFDVQMLNYSLFVWKEFKEIPRFEYAYIKRQLPKMEKTPFYLVQSMQRSDTELRSWERELQRILKKMASTVLNKENFSPWRSIILTGGESCSSCPFLHPCQAEFFNDTRISLDMMRLLGYRKRGEINDREDESQSSTE